MIILISPAVKAASELDSTKEVGFEPFFTIYNLLEDTVEGYLTHEVLEDTFSQIGINLITSKVVPYWFKVFSWTAFNGVGYPIPTYENGGFDISTSIASYGLTFGHWLCTPAQLEAKKCDWTYNFGYNDSGALNDLALEYYQTFNESKKQDIMNLEKELNAEELPNIAIGKKTNTVAFADGFDLTDEEKLGITVSNVEADFFTDGWANIEYPNTDYIKIASILDSYEPDLYYYHLVPYLESIVASIDGHFIFNNLLYEGLYQRDASNKFHWKNVIAAGMPELSANNTIITIPLNQNVVFADGTHLNATDVVNTYQMLFTLGKTHDFFYTDILADPSAIKIIDEYTIQFNLTYPTSNYMEYFDLPIVPTHTWGNYTEVGSAFGILNDLFNDLKTNGTSQYGFGTGPFTLSGFETLGPYVANITLSANPNYWQGDVKSNKISILNYQTKGSEVFQDIKSGKIHIATENTLKSAYFALDRTSDQSNLLDILEKNNIDYTRIMFNDVHHMFINHFHPIFGSGVDTPIAKENPNNTDIAREAAKNVRKAINHAIPREFLSIAPAPIGMWGFSSIPDNSIDITLRNLVSLDFEYNLTLAREYMEKAGYEYPPDSSPTTEQTTFSTFIVSTSDQSVSPTFGFYLCLVITAVIMRKFRRSELL